MIYRLQNTYVNATRWNVPRPTDNGRGGTFLRPLDTDLCKDHPEVQRTNYMEVHELLGTSGCSPSPECWNWVCLGVLKNLRGRLVVCPGDWIVEFADGSLHIYTNEDFERAFAQVEGVDPNKRQRAVAHS